MTTDSTKFLRRASLFSFLLLSAVICFNFLYIIIIERQTVTWRNFFQLDQYLRNHHEIDYAFFGTSRTRDSMNPQIIPNSVNFSIAGQGYVLIYYRLKYYLDEYDLNIKNIVLEMDSSSVSDRFSSNDPLANYDTHFYFPFRDLLSITKMDPISVIIRSRLPFVGRGLQAYGLLRIPKTELYLGWAKEYGDFSINKMPFEPALELLKSEQTVPNEQQLEYFMKTVKLAKEKEMKIYLLKNPHAFEYDEFLKKHSITYDEYYDFVYSELEKEGIDYVVLDYYSVLGQQDSLFHIDAGHVNYKGAEAVSNRFVKDVIDKMR